MHASNLLKAVLTPRAVNSSGRALTPRKDTNTRGTRSSSPDTRSASVNVAKKSSPAPKPVKMSCLCAPTNHAGSFRCRLHRGTQQSWGGRPVGPAGPAGSSSSKPVSAAPEKAPASTPVVVGNGNLKRSVHQLPTPPRVFTTNYHPAHRSADAKPSRLSRVSVASDVEPPISDAEVQSPVVVKISGNNTGRYLKFTTAAGCASGAVLEGGMVFIKKLQTGGKDVMLDVFGSGTHLSRMEMSL